MATLVSILTMLVCSLRANEAEVGQYRIELLEAIPLHYDPLDDHHLELGVRLDDAGRLHVLRSHARTYNTGDHVVRVVEQGRDGAFVTATIDLRIEEDPWHPGLTAQIAFCFDPLGGIGTFQAVTEFPGKEARHATAGRLSVAPTGPWPVPIAGHRPLAPDEHPRLVVRRDDLPELRQKATTPLGRRAVDALVGFGQKGGGIGGIAAKRATWPAAALGFAYLLTGDEAHAHAAARQIETVVFDPAAAGYRAQMVQDIHYAPFVLGLALAYDACHPVWDAQLRARCVTEIARRCRELQRGIVDGRRMRGMNTAVWSNHNAIRVSCMGIGALAILGAEGTDAEWLETIIDRAAVDVRDYIRFGIGASGLGMEGHFYKHMTLERGVMQFMRAHRLVRGARLTRAQTAHWYVAGEFHARQLADDPPAGQGATFWATLFMTGPAAHMQVFRHFWQEAGEPLGGGFTALHTLCVVPAVEAAAPTRAYPWWLPDERKGCEKFRPFPRTEPDPQVLLNLKHDLRRSCHYERSGAWPSLEVTVFATRWLLGRPFPTLPHAPVANNPFHGPHILRRHEPVARVAELDLDLARQYFQVLSPEAEPERQLARQAGARELTVPNWGRLVYDHGIAGTRSLVVDCSGESGAPLLIAWLDRLENVPEAEPEAAVEVDMGDIPPGLAALMRQNREPEPGSRLALNLNGELRDAVVATGSRLRVGPATGANLAAWALHDGGWSDGAVTVAADHRYLVVLSFQEGAAPTLELTGEPGAERIRIGARRLAVVDDRLRCVVDAPSSR
ncbi:MAG: hypothetical protein ACOCYP_05270 [Planctomycetota bacterium]